MPNDKTLKLTSIVTVLVAAVSALLGSHSSEAETIGQQKAEIEKLKQQLRDEEQDDADVDSVIDQLDNLANMAAAANPPSPTDVQTAATIGATPPAPAAVDGGGEPQENTGGGGPTFK